MKKILSAVLACAATMSIATCAFATPAAPESGEPAASPKAPIEAETKVKVGKEGIQGADLEKAVLTVEGKQYKWSDVEEVTFTAETVFKITLTVKAGTVKGDDKATTFVVDKDELAKGATAVQDGYATAHTLTAELLAAVNEVETPNVKLEGKDGAEVEVTANVTISANATPVEPDAENKNTGIALAIAPAGLAVAFVTVAAVMNKKKKG